MVAYERNNKTLISLYQTQPFNHSHFVKLFKVTYEVRRTKIRSCSLATTALKNEFPYFACEKWVSYKIKLSTCLYVCIILCVYIGEHGI